MWESNKSGGESRGRSLKIGLVASARFPIREPFAGGLEAQTHQLASGLRQRGHEVTVFAAQESDPALGYEAVGLKEHRLRLSEEATQDVSMPSSRFMGEHHAYLDLMLSLPDRDFDLIHNNSLHYLPVAMADALPFPMLTSLHTPPTPWIESAVQASGATVSWTAVSSFTARQWRPLIDARVIPNGVDTEFWRPEPGRRRSGAVWSGRIVAEKAPHLALEAAKLEGTALTLAGPISDRDYFACEVEPLLDCSRRYAGHLSRPALRDLIAGSEVALVSPEWDEPYGLVIAEALSCGTPVAAFDRGAVSELLGPTTGCLAAAGDVESLASAIGGARGLRSEDCRRRAVERASISAMLTGYEDAYRALL